MVAGSVSPPRLDLANEDLRQLLLTLRSDDLAAEATATFTNLSIRADKIEGVK